MKKVLITLIFCLLIANTAWSLPTYAEDHPEPTNIEENE